MPATPAISFLVCTRNRAEVARHCVLHLLDTPRQDIEVVVRDNCSTDNTVALLRAIDDKRLAVHVASENQGTLSFYEISRLAAGEVVTWLSDEDDFQFEQLEFVLQRFRTDMDCNVMFGGIVVGAAARRVCFAEETVTDPIRALITALSFSGCGGLFVRGSALKAANSFAVSTIGDAYALWNYYPVGFFASRCLTGHLVTTSRVVVVQARFARTTNNWSNVGTQTGKRLPHYYPESVFDRLASNLVNLFFKPLPVLTKLRAALESIRLFHLQVGSYANPAVHQLLRENYPTETVEGYLAHIRTLRLDRSAGRFLWPLGRILALPIRIARTMAQWRRLAVRFEV